MRDHYKSSVAGLGKQKGKKKKQHLNKNRSGGEALHKKAVHLHIQGDIENSEKAYREAIKAGSLHQSTFSNLGIICKNSDRAEEAIILYKNQ